MSNTLITSSMVAKESLRLLENNLVFAKGANRQFEKEWDTDRAIGDTINARIPSRYTVRSGPAASVQNHVDTVVPVVINSQKGIDVQFSSKDLTLNFDDFSERVLKPQIVQLANQVDLDGLALFNQIPHAVGVPGTTPNALLTYLNAGVALDNAASPQDDERFMLVTPLAQATIVDSLKGLFQSSTEISSQYKRGKMGMAGGFDWAMSQNLPTFTVGPQGGTPLVSGNATATGATAVASKGWTSAAASRLVVGDVITFANVYAVNPLSKQSTGQLKQFVVTAAFSSDGSGNGSISVSPPLNLTGALQNITALPVDGNAITVLGAANAVSPVCLAYHKDAFTLVTAEMPLPKGMDMASRASSSETGLSIRFVRGYDIMNDVFISRLDILYGWACVRPEFACRVQA